MTTPFRIGLALLSLASLSASSGRAQTATAETAPTEAELTALLASLPTWTVWANVEAGFGFKDNLLLGHANEEQSALMRGQFDAGYSRPRRLPDGRTDWFFSATGDETRYFSGRELKHETEAAMRGAWRYRQGDEFSFSLDLAGAHLNSVFDISDSDIFQTVAVLKVFSAALEPTFRWTPRPWIWLQAKGSGSRLTSEDGFFNSHIGDGALRLGWRPGARFEASIDAAERSRSFDQRTQFSASGREIANSHLRTVEREEGLRADVTWDQAATWKTVTRVSTLRHRDNGSGYFSYRQRRVSHELEWHRGNWQATLDGSAAHVEWVVQTVGFGITPPPRVKDEFSVDLRIERALSKRWAIFATGRWERSRCNDPVASYVANEGLLGARWSWEK